MKVIVTRNDKKRLSKEQHRRFLKSSCSEKPHRALVKSQVIEYLFK